MNVAPIRFARREEKELNFGNWLFRSRDLFKGGALGESPISTDREKTDIKRKRKGKVEVERNGDLRGKISRGEFITHL